MIFNNGTGGSGWNSALNELGAKNLARNIMSDVTKSGITFKVQADKTIISTGKNTSSGTTSTDGNVIFDLLDVLEVGKKYIVSGCPKGGSTETYRITVREIIGENRFFYQDLGEGVLITPKENCTSLQAYINVNSGVSVDGLVWKPMVRPASITDSTYAPYAMTNKEITDALTSVKPSYVIGSFDTPDSVASDTVTDMTVSFDKELDFEPAMILFSEDMTTQSRAGLFNYAVLEQSKTGFKVRIVNHYKSAGGSRKVKYVVLP